MYHFTKEERVSIDQAVEEMLQSFSRQDREKNLRRDIVDRMKEEFSLDSKVFNTIVKERLNDKVSEQVSELQTALDLNDELLASRR